MQKRAIVTSILAVIAVLLLGTAVAVLIRRPRQVEVVVEPLSKIRIANIGIYSDYNVLAARSGLFRARGLDAMVDEYDSGATSIGALLSGKDDVAVAANFVGVRNMFSTGDLVILATASSHDVWRLVARSDLGVAKPSDLKGKKIGLTRKTAAEFYLGKFLVANGVRLGDVTMVDLPASDVPARLDAGAVDAAMMFDPNAFQLQQSRPGLAEWPAQGGRRELATLYTTRAFADAHPDVLERYLQALVDAERYQETHGAEAERAFAAAMGYDAGTADRL